MQNTGKTPFLEVDIFHHYRRENRRLKRETELLRQEREVLKKALRASFRATSHKISVHRRAAQRNTVELLCEALDVSESGYYAWKHRESSDHEREDACIAALIQQIFQEHRYVYGSPRIHAKLRDYGVHCSRKRVVRLMQSASHHCSAQALSQAHDKKRSAGALCSQSAQS